MNEKNKKKTLRIFVIGLAFSLFGMGFLAGFISELTTIENMPIEEATEEVAKRWRPVQATNITVANTDTGIMNVMTYTHQSSPYTLYDDALDEDNAYEHMDGTPACGEELEHETPHSTLFDIVVIIQWGYAEAYNTSSSQWEKGLVQVYINITSTDTELNAVSSEVMLEGDFYDIDAGNDAKMNCYVVGTGGFDLGQDVTFTINDIKLYYWG